jgi:single-strand DNA-binding protein
VASTNAFIKFDFMYSNRVLLIGYVGQELDTQKLENGTKRVGIRLATHYPQKTDQGDKIYNTVWHDVVAWSGTAEYAERSFVKGSRIMVDGTIDYRKFTGRHGSTIKMTIIQARSLMNLDR